MDFDKLIPIILLIIWSLISIKAKKRKALPPPPSKKSPPGPASSAQEKENQIKRPPAIPFMENLKKTIETFAGELKEAIEEDTPSSHQKPPIPIKEKPEPDKNYQKTESKPRIKAESMNDIPYSGRQGIEELRPKSFQYKNISKTGNTQRTPRRKISTQKLKTAVILSEIIAPPISIRE